MTPTPRRSRANEVGGEAGDLAWIVEGDVRVRADVVLLDRQRRPLHAERVEQLGLGGERLPRRDRLVHATERDARPLALEPDGDDARARLEPHLDELHRPAEDEGRPQGRMPGERQLDARRVDPDPRVTAVLAREDEHGLGEVQLAREPLQRRLGDLPRVREDGDGIALERRIGEHVRDDVAEARHGARIYRADYDRRVRVLVVRHAEAGPGEPDELRTLTPAGREQARELGRRLAGRGDRDGADQPPRAGARDCRGDRREVGVVPESDEELLAPGRRRTPCARPWRTGPSRSSSSATSPTAAGSSPTSTGHKPPAFPPAGVFEIEL